jgi:glycosyltransferase involved in cell wall biosynthesis
MSKRPESPELSVIVPVGPRVDELGELHAGYVRSLDATGLAYELIYVLDGIKPELRAELTALSSGARPIKIVQLNKSFGEATALMAGFAYCAGARILTLPAYFQIEAAELGKLITAQQDADMVVACRWPRRGGWFDTLRRSAYHGLQRFVVGGAFRDLGCGVRIFDRRVFEEITLYGDQYRLLPVLAANQGFRVREVEVAQSPKDDFRGRYRVRDHLHRALDIFTVFFLVRFTKKPLRFFGMIGSALVAVGTVLTIVLIVQRLFFDQGLADRPALLLTSLILVVGVQLFALGLLGELIIFTHARDIKEYKVAEIVEAQPTGSVRAANGDQQPTYSRSSQS